MNQDQGIYFFHQGTNYYSYKLMGAHIENDGVMFRVWAPRAKKISVIGDFNHWDRKIHSMERVTEQGIWELFIPGVKEFTAYKYAILNSKNRWVEKSDPYAFHSELRPNTASKVFNLDGYKFGDSKWMKSRLKKHYYNRPLNIYELNLASWRTYQDGNFFDYVKLGEELSSYVKKMGFTHVEIMPISEFPYDPSWGYQVTGFYSITSRFGTPKQFMQFVDILHQNDIGVIVDWVPGHFCKDLHGLIEFDGTYLYEPRDPLIRELPGWGTRQFDYGRTEIQSFLISNALYLFEEYHIDGLRVDAVASMLYLDYCRENGKWRKNNLGTNINLEAEAFIKKLNKVIHEYYPDVITIAEESTTYPKLTESVDNGGLGFSYKWNMGWMNDTLSYIKTDPIYRQYEHDKITFQLTYAYSEKFILPLSHDEVVHGKLSIINRMPGDYKDKFNAFQTYLMYTMSHPGKKLNFMGYELGQMIEWRDDREIDWLLLQYPQHQDFHRFVEKLNNFYLKNKPLYELDDSWEGFNWITVDDKDHNTFVYERCSAKGEKIIVVINFAYVDWKNYSFNLADGKYRIVLASNDIKYGGYNHLINKIVEAKDGKLTIDLPSNCGLYLRKVDKNEKE